MMLRKFYSNIQASRKPTIWSLIIRRNLSVPEDFQLANETLATTVNLDTDIDLRSNDMSNVKHTNIGTR